jgi:polysaccharide export outer membrane protein
MLSRSGVYRLFQPALTALVFALTLAACSSQPDLPEVADDKRFPEQDYMYIVGPGDTMEIFVWGNEELTTGGIVRPDGKFTTRLVEDLEASGKTSTHIVNGFVGIPEQQVRVVGEATQPTSIPYRKHMTLLDLMIAVGGMTEYAAGNKSVLVRLEEGGQVSYGLRLDDLVKDGDISANLNLMPGDIVIISESWF